MPHETRHVQYEREPLTVSSCTATRIYDRIGKLNAGTMTNSFDAILSGCVVHGAAAYISIEMYAMEAAAAYVCSRIPRPEDQTRTNAMNVLQGLLDTLLNPETPHLARKCLSLESTKKFPVDIEEIVAGIKMRITEKRRFIAVDRKRGFQANDYYKVYGIAFASELVFRLLNNSNGTTAEDFTSQIAAALVNYYNKQITNGVEA